jgi:hypothetical protein
MDKESIYELQLIDANCNDCKFMVRDNDALKRSQEFHRKLQLNEFERVKERLRQLSLEKRRQGDLESYNDLAVQHDKMKFQFDRNANKINFGHCSKLDKAVTFIPNHCQIETQTCFIHRRESH